MNTIATENGPLTFGRLQAENRDWAEYNFGDVGDGTNAFIGMTEEMGELAHAFLKSRQGIRGTPEEHRAAERDALGDILIYMADYCNRRGIDLQCAVEDAWAQVRRRDWRRFPKDGVSA